jgi:hypothetical protein
MIDWQATEDYARSLDTYTLKCALKDAIDTAFAMDALDRAMPLGGNACRAGKYRDQCSVYRKVLNERK